MATFKRQYVNYQFFKVDPLWRRLPAEEREAGKKEFEAVVAEFDSKVMTVPYSTVGIRPEVDFMLWRISYELEDLQDMMVKVLQTRLGKYLNTPYSYLAMTKRSTYVDKHSHEGSESKRLTVVPGEAKYLFIYPFVKTREWYLLTKSTRQGMMNEHIEIGHKYPTVKINTSYSFGLDDYEFVVAFESDFPGDFLDLVMELREAEASRFTLLDTPIFTCVRKNIKDALNDLGG
ncbi:MAG: chlorite dismutase family protein [Nitrospiria bacterium]